MKTRVLILISLALVATYYYMMYRASKTLAFSYQLPQKVSLKGGMLSWVQNINVSNGDAASIPITSVSVDNIIGGKYYGKTALINPVVLKGQAVTVLPLVVNIPAADLLGLGFDALNIIKSGSVNLKFKGVINAVGISIPLEKEIQMPINF